MDIIPNNGDKTSTVKSHTVTSIMDLSIKDDEQQIFNINDTISGDISGDVATIRTYKITQLGIPFWEDLTIWDNNVSRDATYPVIRELKSYNNNIKTELTRCFDISRALRSQNIYFNFKFFCPLNSFFKGYDELKFIIYDALNHSEQSSVIPLTGIEINDSYYLISSGDLQLSDCIVVDGGNRSFTYYRLYGKKNGYWIYLYYDMLFDFI